MRPGTRVVGSLFSRDPPVVDLDQTALCWLLSNERRVLAIEAFRDRESSDMKTLATEIAPLVGATRDSVYVSLYQNHIDQLLEADVLAGEARGELRPGPNFDAVVSILDELDRRTSGGRP